MPSHKGSTRLLARISAIFNRLRPKSINTAPIHFFRDENGNVTTMEMERLLDLLVRKSDYASIKSALWLDADPNLVSDVSGPAILEAANILDITSIDILLESKRVRVNTANKLGVTALYRAVKPGYGIGDEDKRLEVVEKLLAAGADPLAPTIYGVTPYSAAVESEQFKIVAAFDRVLEKRPKIAPFMP